MCNKGVHFLVIRISVFDLVFLYFCKVFLRSDVAVTKIMRASLLFLTYENMSKI